MSTISDLLLKIYESEFFELKDYLDKNNKTELTEDDTLFVEGLFGIAARAATTLARRAAPALGRAARSSSRQLVRAARSDVAKDVGKNFLSGAAFELGMQGVKSSVAPESDKPSSENEKEFKLRFKDKTGKYHYRKVKAPDLKTAIKYVAFSNQVHRRSIEEY